MNYGISILFRAIPLLMALFCFGYGAFVLDMGTDVNRFVAGPVVFSLGMICIALFATAAHPHIQHCGKIRIAYPRLSGCNRMFHWRNDLYK